MIYTASGSRNFVTHAGCSTSQQGTPAWLRDLSRFAGEAVEPLALPSKSAAPDRIGQTSSSIAFLALILLFSVIPDCLILCSDPDRISNTYQGGDVLWQFMPQVHATY